MPRFFIALFLCLIISGCAQRGRIVFDPAAAEVGTVQRLYFATSRMLNTTSPTYFDYVRNETPIYGRLEVSIPPDRKPGEVHWPPKRGKPDSRTDFVATEATLYDGSPDFLKALRGELRSRARGHREVVVFVHGFNNNFAESAYRIAQLGQDIGIKDVLAHYAWPSRAEALGYIYDRDSALFARDGLVGMLETIDEANGEGIILVAHSMGSAVTMEALRQLAIGKRKDILRTIRGVVLLSPDIDIDVFRSQARTIGTLPDPFFIFVSQKDSALGLSARLSGEQNRLGNIRDPRRIADLKVTVLDTTEFSTGLGHFDVGSSPALISLVGKMANVYASFDKDTAGRTGLISGAVISVQNATEIVARPLGASAGN